MAIISQGGGTGGNGGCAVAVKRVGEQKKRLGRLKKHIKEEWWWVGQR